MNENCVNDNEKKMAFDILKSLGLISEEDHAKLMAGIGGANQDGSVPEKKKIDIDKIMKIEKRMLSHIGMLQTSIKMDLTLVSSCPCPDTVFLETNTERIDAIEDMIKKITEAVNEIKALTA